MSRKGNCWDNAPTERFFRSMKYESLNYQRFATRAMAKLAIIDYLAFYNGRRIHSVLDYKTPLAFDQEYVAKKLKTAQEGAPGRRDLGQSTNRGRGASVGMNFSKEKNL